MEEVKLKKNRALEKIIAFSLGKIIINHYYHKLFLSHLIK